MPPEATSELQHLKIFLGLEMYVQSTHIRHTMVPLNWHTAETFTGNTVCYSLKFHSQVSNFGGQPRLGDTLRKRERSTDYVGVITRSQSELENKLECWDEIMNSDSDSDSDSD